MHTGHESFWPDYANFVRTVFSSGPNILDVGTPQPFRKELAAIALPDPKPRVWTLDYPTSTSRSQVSVYADAAHLPFRDGFFDGLICKDVLEHVRDPFATARELARVLRPGGRLFVNLLGIHPYHAGAYGDYWRYTEDAVRELFPTLDCDVRRAGGWAYILRAYAPQGALGVLRTRLGSAVLNAVDRMIPSRHATVMHFVLATKPTVTYG
jgi:SAM-dependent methyltransferase